MNRYKKSIILFAAFFFVSLQAFSQNSPVDEFINKYANDTNFTVVSMGPQMLAQAHDSDLNNITGMHILKTSKNAQQVFDEAVRQLNVPPYKVQMSVRQGKKNILCLGKDDNNQVSESILLVWQEDQFVLIDMAGKNLDLGSLGNLGNLGNVSNTQNSDNK